MGSLRTAQVIALEARERSRDVGRSLGTTVDRRFGEDPRLRAAAERYQGLRSETSDRTRKVAERTRAGLERANDTAAARKVGDASRRVGREVRNLPVLSLANDAIAKRHGVHLLARSFTHDPTDPERNLWLAEALDRAARDRRLYANAKALVDPSSIVTRAGFQVTAGLGTERQLSTEEQLLTRANALAAARVQADPRDADALHVLARVQLARGDAEKCVRFAKLAAQADPSRSGRALVTLARGYEAQGRYAVASHAAGLALQQGCTLAYEVLADLEPRREDEDGSGRLKSSRDRIARAVRLRDRVEDEDRRSYWGVSVSGGTLARDVASAQWDKTKSTTQRLRRTVGESRRG